MIDLALLGCGGGMPIPNRHLSSILINCKGRKILIDCGEGTQVSMKLLGWGFKSIDIICITHGHCDHTVGLPGLLATIGNSGRTEPLTIVGPKGIIDIINGLRVIVPYLPYKINIIECEKQLKFDINKEGIIKVNKSKDSQIEIDTIELDHSTNCQGYSFYIKRTPKFNVEKATRNNVPKKIWNVLQKGQMVELDDVVYYPYMVLGDERKGIKISIITDSRPLKSIIPFINKSDLFICEGTYGSNEDYPKAIKNKHMTFNEAALLAYEGNVEELLLTHFSPAMNNPEDFINNATDIFSNTILGEDRLIKNLSFKD